MCKKPFFRILLFGLVLFGMGLEQTSCYLENGNFFTITQCDFEQDQEDNSGESKSAKSDKYRPSANFSPLAPIIYLAIRRCQIPVYSEGSLSAAFLPIFTPPPEQV